MEEINSGIYKLTSPSGKIYIGQSVNFKKRFSEYKRLDCKSQRKLHKSLIKYGSVNFKYEILYTLEKNNKYYYIIINQMEKYFIKKYNSIKNGYNIEFGGKNSKCSDETKILIGNSNRGKIHSEEQNKKMSLIHKGKILTDDHKLNISKGLKGKYVGELNSQYGKIPHNIKPIIQLTINGEFIKEWIGAMYIEKELNISSQNIGKVCLNKRKTAGGFKWKYKEII